ESQFRALLSRARNDLATAYDGQAWRADADRLQRIGCLQDDEIGVFALRDAVVGKIERGGTAIGDAVEHLELLLADEHPAPDDGHMGNVEHLALAERIPRVHHRILSEGDVDA